MWKVPPESFQTNVIYKRKFYYSQRPSFPLQAYDNVRKAVGNIRNILLFEIPFKIFILLLIGSAFETNIFHDYVASITRGGRSWPEPISNFRGKDEMTIIEL